MPDPRPLPEIRQLISEDHPRGLHVYLFDRVVDRFRAHVDATAYITLSVLVHLVDDDEPSESNRTTLRVGLATHAAESAAAYNRLVQILDDRSKRVGEVYRCAEYLASERIGIFESHFELIRDNDSTVLLDDALVSEALRTDRLVDPDTGRDVRDWMSHVNVFYSGTDLFIAGLKAWLGAFASR